MRIVVAERAKRNRNKIAAYILGMFGQQALLNFRDAYKQTKKVISNHPEGGEIEWNLSTENTKYRFKIINGLTKMIYRVAEDTIYIVDMWDTRSEPPSKIRES